MRVPRSLSSLLRRSTTASVLSLALAACGTPSQQYDEPGETESASLAGADELFAGAPDPSTLPFEGKADAVYPAKYTDLLKYQSPVKNQGSRGVCSIFSTVAYMEHLYLKAGVLAQPDFSEQYLQWSVKNEVKGMTDSEASSGAFNLEAINRFGIVEEAQWPYESSRWGTSQDPACTGGDKGLPVRCYTNGEPPAAAKAAQKWKLPVARFLRTDPNSIKAHMTGKKTAVHVAVRFYYQAWNHGLSKLPVSRDYSRNGWVLSPNEEDKKQTPAGHAILLVGWDDELAVQKRDKDGKGVVDAKGQPVLEKGFFLFKNSWGTSSFGVTHPAGPGYGYISYDYIRQYGVANVADVPKAVEMCGDGKDNDGDGQIDCADTDCSGLDVCRSQLATFSSSRQLSIPDASTTGIADSITVTGTGTVKGVTIITDITHPRRADLTVTLVKGTKKVVLFDRQGTGRDLQEVFDTAAFNGESMAGTWTLRVVDNTRSNTGKLNGWEIEIRK